MKLLHKLAAVALVALFSSCDKDDETLISETNLPSAIKTYVATHFPNNAVSRAVKDTDDNKITYDISLAGNFELEFDESFNIIDIDGRTQLPDSVIPQAIRTYVTTNYPGQFITDWELELNHQQVELNNGLDLEFNMDGSFIRIDR